MILSLPDGFPKSLSLERIVLTTPRNGNDPSWQIRMDNIGVTAIDEDADYRVLSFNINTTVDVKSPPARLVSRGDPIGELPALERKGYTHSGWNTKTDGTGDTYTEATVFNQETNLVLYAQWTPNTYTLTFDVNAEGATVAQASKTVTYDAEIGALPIPEYEGFSFYGWNLTGDGSGAMYYESTKFQFPGAEEVVQDTVLYARWFADNLSLTISFDTDVTGMPNPDSKVVRYNKPVGDKEYRLPEVTRDGYIFTGWYREGVSAKITASTIFETGTPDLVLKARWDSTTCCP
jgi:uncharacterized repeat protein (TIGR02543 family)